MAQRQSNELMALTNTGNLGIGLTNPTHKLSVSGTSKVTGVATFNNAVFIDGVLTVQDATISNLTGNVTGNIISSGVSTVSDLKATSSIGIGTDAGNDAFRVYSGVQNRFFIDNVGNVGIKTTEIHLILNLMLRGCKIPSWSSGWSNYRIMCG